MATRIALLLIGAWLAGTVGMWVVATTNFRVADRIAGQPPAPARAILESPAGRPLLRYFASELNRRFFWIWGAVQLALAVAIVLPAARASSRDFVTLALATALVVLALAMLGLITPVIVSLGREMDFVPRDPPPPQMRRFGLFHAVYSVLDLLKAVLLGLLGWRILRS